jgi:hypothetical protein
MIFRPFANLTPRFRGLSPLQQNTHIHICRCHSDTKSLAWVLGRLPHTSSTSPTSLTTSFTSRTIFFSRHLHHLPQLHLHLHHINHLHVSSYIYINFIYRCSTSTYLLQNFYNLTMSSTQGFLHRSSYTVVNF